MEFKILQSDMIAAMKAHDKTTKDAVSSLIAAIKKVAIDEGVRENITEEICDRVILKELKTVKEQIDTCPENRTDLIDAYKATYDIIAKYAPKMLSADEVKEIILRDFAEVAATKNKGMIMKNVMGTLKGKAEGVVINQVVADLCK
ncbi:MAG: GatB/YqeY domain-containing protein [Clostridia bacterium]|nr:GatB/YqeY domain-containing protein [Clostridia bacterium]